MRPHEQGTAEKISREEKNIKKRPREGMIATRQKTFNEKEGVADFHEHNHQDERRKGQQRPGKKRIEILAEARKHAGFYYSQNSVLWNCSASAGLT